MTKKPSDDKNSPVEPRNSNATIWWLSGATAAYVIVIAWVLSNGIVETTTSGELSDNWLMQRIQSVSSSELGDTLAGIFAPLAFVWLAGTVFIQSQELRAQREELI